MSTREPMTATPKVAPAPSDPFATHQVFNQPPPLQEYDVFSCDRPLVEALRREGGSWAEGRARGFGEICGRAETIALGFLANEHRPVLRAHDRAGRRVDEVDFHAAWHALLGLGVEHGLHALPWREPRPGAHVARAAMFATLAQVEAGVGCPLSMTFSAVPALRLEPGSPPSGCREGYQRLGLAGRSRTRRGGGLHADRPRHPCRRHFGQYDLRGRQERPAPSCRDHPGMRGGTTIANIVAGIYWSIVLVDP